MSWTRSVLGLLRGLVTVGEPPVKPIVIKVSRGSDDEGLRIYFDSRTRLSERRRDHLVYRGNVSLVCLEVGDGLLAELLRALLRTELDVLAVGVMPFSLTIHGQTSNEAIIEIVKSITEQFLGQPVIVDDMAIH